MTHDYPISQYLPEASALIYGCMGLGGGWNSAPVSRKDIQVANEAVDAALAQGITVFDHADIYTFGKAETVFGRLLKDRPELRDTMLIQSKCAIRFADDKGPKRYDFSRAWIEQSVDGILNRLGIERLEVLLLHRPDPLMEPDEVAHTLRRLRESGKVRFFGVSNMHGAQMALLQDAMDEPLVVNQIEVSLAQLGWLEEGVLAGNPLGTGVNFAHGTIEYCRRHGVQIQSWGSLAQGVFSGREDLGVSEAVVATRALVAEMAEQHRVGREAIVLGWLMRHPAMVQPVIGSVNPGRIAACAQAVELKLTREEWYRLYESARGSELP